MIRSWGGSEVMIMHLGGSRCNEVGNYHCGVRFQLSVVAMTPHLSRPHNCPTPATTMASNSWIAVSRMRQMFRSSRWGLADQCQGSYHMHSTFRSWTGSPIRLPRSHSCTTPVFDPHKSQVGQLLVSRTDRTYSQRRCYVVDVPAAMSAQPVCQPAHR